MVGILLLTGVTIRLLFRSWEKIVVRRSSLLANASDYSALTVLVRTAGHLAKKPTTAAEACALCSPNPYSPTLTLTLTLTLT